MLSIPIPPTEEFRACLRSRDTAQKTFRTESDAIQTAYHAALEADFRKAFPRRKWSLDRASDCPNGATLRATFQSQADALYQRHQERLNNIASILTGLAATIPLWTCGPLRHVASVSVSTYSSQGYGASRYAERHAQMIADKAQFHGLTSEVRPDGPARSDNHWGITYQDYAVWANTDEDGWTLLEHKPDVPLKDWLRMCWKRGANPRVYNPWLPVGLEERLGLDYFGNDTAPAAPATPVAA